MSPISLINQWTDLTLLSDGNVCVEIFDSSRRLQMGADNIQYVYQLTVLEYSNLNILRSSVMCFVICKLLPLFLFHFACLEATVVFTR